MLHKHKTVPYQKYKNYYKEIIRSTADPLQRRNTLRPGGAASIFITARVSCQYHGLGTFPCTQLICRMMHLMLS
jgi:hypothetical protein